MQQVSVMAQALKCPHHCHSKYIIEMIAKVTAHWCNMRWFIEWRLDRSIHNGTIVYLLGVCIENIFALAWYHRWSNLSTKAMVGHFGNSGTCHSKQVVHNNYTVVKRIGYCVPDDLLPIYSICDSLIRGSLYYIQMVITI